MQYKEVLSHLSYRNQKRNKYHHFSLPREELNKNSLLTKPFVTYVLTLSSVTYA